MTCCATLSTLAEMAAGRTEDLRQAVRLFWVGVIAVDRLGMRACNFWCCQAALCADRTHVFNRDEREWRQTGNVCGSSSAFEARRSARCNGGGGRNRTGIDGFAGRCITTLPPRQGRLMNPEAHDRGSSLHTSNTNQRCTDLAAHRIFAEKKGKR